jgi:hypothetical protein
VKILKKCSRMFKTGDVIKAGTLLQVIEDLSKNRGLSKGQYILLFEDTVVVKPNIYDRITVKLKSRTETLFLDECKIVMWPSD